MSTAIRRNWLPFATILVFAGLSTALGLYTLSKQRLQLPGGDRYEVEVEFADVPGLAPGLGQPATVAGVKVGQITKARVQDGHALVTLTIDRHKLPHVYADASATMVPNTPLQDLQVDLRPGGPPSPELADGEAIALSRTTGAIGSDRFLAALDDDTRQFMTALIDAAGAGVRGRGPDLRALYRAIGPTANQIDELSSALAARRDALAATVHSLSVLAVAAGDRDQQLRSAVQDGSATLAAMASEDVALQAALRELPGTLQAARSSLPNVQALAGELGPSLTALEPAVRALPAGLEATQRLSVTAVPVLRSTLRPLVREASDAVAPLPSTLQHLTAVTPDLEQSFKVLEYLANELFWTDGGRQRGYPFWYAWAQHNGNSVLQTGDAHGQVVRSALIFSCSSFQAVPELQTVLDGVTSLLGDACPAIQDSADGR